MATQVHNLSTHNLSSKSNLVVEQLLSPASINLKTNHPPRKWTYILANHIRLVNNTDAVIRLPRPHTNRLKSWVEKIVSAGQCEQIFVEQLSMDELSYKRLQQLCAQHQVKLVNLLINSKRAQVIKGPWLN
jgi:hypothetical protein